MPESASFLYVLECSAFADDFKPTLLQRRKRLHRYVCFSLVKTVANQMVQS